MERMIRHIIEPERLFLVWQAPESTPSDRSRKKVAELVSRPDGIVALRYLRHTEQFDMALELGFTGYPSFPLESEYHDTGVLETFMRRMPPRKRRDYPEFLRNWRIDPGSQMSPMALLGYVGAQLPGDGFSLVHPFDNGCPPFEFLGEVAGLRYRDNISSWLPTLQPGQEVLLCAEPDNTHDQHAIRIEMKDGPLIGYVNRVQSQGLHRWLHHPGVRGFIDRCNGTQARPLVYIMFEVGGA